MNTFKKVLFLLVGFASVHFASASVETKIDDGTVAEWVKTVTLADEHLTAAVEKLKKDEAYTKDILESASKGKIDAFELAVKAFTSAKGLMDEAKKALDAKTGDDKKAETEAVISKGYATVALYHKALTAHHDALDLVSAYYTKKAGKKAALTHLKALDTKLTSGFLGAMATVALLTTVAATL